MVHWPGAELAAPAHVTGPYRMSQADSLHLDEHLARLLAAYDLSLIHI